MASPLKEQIHHLINCEKISSERGRLEDRRISIESELSLDPESEILKDKLLEIDHSLDEFDELSEKTPEELRVTLVEELNKIHPEDPIDIGEYNQALELQNSFNALEKNLKLISDHLQVILNTRSRIKRRGIFSYILSVSPNTYIEQTLMTLEKLLPNMSNKDIIPGLKECLDKLEVFVKQNWSFKTVDTNIEGFQKEVEDHLSEVIIEKSASKAMIRAQEAHLDRSIEDKGLLN